MTDLELAYKTLAAKIAPYTTYFDYADGQQPLKYSTSRLREAFQNLNAHFSQNWVSVVVNSTIDRMNLTGLQVEDENINKFFADVFSEQNIGLEADDVHRAAVICNDAYLIIWKEDNELQTFYNDPRTCHIFYESANPKQKRFACKWFIGDDGRYKMILYYPDRMEYYTTREVIKSDAIPTSAKAFQPDDPDAGENPYGIIPVFHFRVNRRIGGSDVLNILSLQDAVNKLLADMMVAAEYGAFKQRWIISNADTSTLKNAPNEIWNIPAGDGMGQGAAVGEFAETPLDNYLNAIDKIASSIAIISRTPKHYFYGGGSDVSGEALLAMEAPLTKKVERYMQAIGNTWQEVGSFIALLNGLQVRAVDITPIWEMPQSVQPLTEAQIMETYIKAGTALETAARWVGKLPQDIEQMKDELNKQQKSMKQDTGAQLAALMRNMETDTAQPLPEEEVEE